MKKHIPTLLATMIATTLYSQQGLAANLTSQCMLGMPSYDHPLVQGNTNDLPMTINADHTKGDYPDDTMFTGSMDIMQGNSHLQANKVQLHQKEAPGQPEPVQTIDALSNVHYNNNQVILKGPKGWANLNTKDTNIWEGDYQMVGRQGHSKADLMKQHGKNHYTILDNSSFTSCLPGSDTWSMVGSEIIHDHEEQVAEIWNTHFKVGPVPIFYSPYLQLPVGDKHHSGFLIPNTKYTTTNYFEFYLPYYWNITPNMDATITPHYMHHRGNIMWENKFHYLSQAGTGLMELDYLPSDKVYEDEHPNNDSSHHWLFYWNHSRVMDQVWHFNINYTKVSNPSYFNDFNNKYSSSTDSYTTQKFSIGYTVQNFNATISTKQFQVFSEQNTSSYSAEPQLDINYYQNDVGPFDTRIYSQAVHFVNTRDNMPEATHVHLEPTINLPLSNNWGSINTKAKLLATHYQQTNLDWYNSRNTTKLDKSINHVMPQFKVDSKMVFEHNMEMLAPGYTQTLEPRTQYLYMPYHNQSNIYNYNSSLLQSDYSGLFQDQTYSSLDHIASTNQVTTSVTSHIYDDAAIEHFNISIGQIYYFTESHTGNDNITWENDNKTGSLVWAGNTYWHISKHWGLHGRIQYNTHLDNIATSNSSIEYHQDEDHLVQLNYHYTSPEYIQATLPKYYSTAEQYKNGISQVGAVTSWPIANHWSIVGAYYYNTNANKQANSMLGVQYSSCCYAIHISYKQKLNSWDNNKQHTVYDNTISFNIKLHSLSSNYSLGTQEMLHSNILPYQNTL